jgi:hypothetical protein
MLKFGPRIKVFCKKLFIDVAGLGGWNAPSAVKS